MSPATIVSLESPKAAERKLRTFIRKIIFRSDKPNTRVRSYSTLFGGLIGAVWAIVLAYSFLTPPSYTSKMTLNLPASGTNASVSLDAIGDASSNTASPFAIGSISPKVIYKAIATSARVRGMAAKSLGISYAEMAQPKVVLIDETALILISVTGASPEQAQVQAEALLAALQSQLDILRRDEIDRRIAVVEASLVSVRSDLKDAREALISFQAESPVVSMEQFQSLLDTIEDQRQIISKAKAERDDVMTRRNRLSEILAISPRQAADALRLQSDPRFIAATNDLATALVDHGTASGMWGARHPKVVSARARILSSHAAMAKLGVEVLGKDGKEIVGQLMLSGSSDRAALFRTVVELDAQAAGIDRSIASAEATLAERLLHLDEQSAAAAHLADLERDHKIAEAVFSSALARIDTGRQDLYASYPLLQVVAPPSRPEAPSTPNKLFAFTGGVLAFVLILFAMAMVWLRQPVRQKILKNL